MRRCLALCREEEDYEDEEDDEEERHSQSRAFLGKNAKLREQVLENPGRYTVKFSFSVHTMRMLECCMQLHLVLKFRYPADIIKPAFGAKQPAEDYVHEYGSSLRLFPYCIFNSVDEVPIRWMYQNNNGNVYERVELSATLTFVEYAKHFPFVLKLFPIKVGSDGTGKTGLINLVPDLLPGTAVPNADLGVFTKSTSEFSIGGSDNATVSKKVVCRMLIRDLEDKSIGNIEGIYSRVYVVVFFEVPTVVNLVNYIIIPLLVTQLCTFYSSVELGDILSTILAMVLAFVALLFVMPHGQEVTLATEVLCVEICYCIVVGCICRTLRDRGIDLHDPDHPRHYNLCLDAIFAVCIALRVLWGYVSFRRLAEQIRHKFDPMIPGTSVASFQVVDEEI